MPCRLDQSLLYWAKHDDDCRCHDHPSPGSIVLQQHNKKLTKPLQTLVIMLAGGSMPFSCRHSSYTRQNQAQTLTSTHDPRMHSLDSLGLEADNVCLDFGQHMADRKPIRCRASVLCRSPQSRPKLAGRQVSTTIATVPRKLSHDLPNKASFGNFRATPGRPMSRDFPLPPFQAVALHLNRYQLSNNKMEASRLSRRILEPKASERGDPRNCVPRT